MAKTANVVTGVGSHLLRTVATVLVVGVALTAQGQRTLTIDAIFDPATRVDFSGAPVTTMTWLDADTWLQPQRSGRNVDWVKVDAASGRTTPLFDAARMQQALAALPGVTRAEAELLSRSNALTFNPSRTTSISTTSRAAARRA
jgi:hypothetical protein